MLVGKSNRKVYRIISAVNVQSYLRLELDGSVQFSDGNSQYINVVNHYYYYNYNNSQYQVDRYIEVDNSKTRYETRGHEFDESVVKISDINAALISRAKEEFSTMQTENSNLQTQLAQKERDIEWGKGQLVLRDSKIETEKKEVDRLNTQIKEEREEYKISKENLEKLRGAFTDLQIQNHDKAQEIENQKSKLKDKEEKLGETEQRFLERKIKEKQGKLEKFIGSLEVDRKKITELRKLYRQLVRTRKDNYNQDEIDDIEDKITEIKDEIYGEKKISIDDANSLFEKCEKFAKLKIELEKVRRENQQYQAQQEVPPKNN